ncbi:unnamed protein product [Vitrella brassicaformis CCMP3155]|uniref:Uncharacterized protein n=1 Tax=Vitrella brassicaformis (strain CCMP3155) TaxID=1169540 RepID=A0A0G4FTQ7_VITBC|nr:unnamed protein product [Vitrella brassicaformis CCMP3155]|eukprot:CEM18326.1 unnamed protein product [Vitrella brassicaformis CCMP3155]
MDQRRKTAHLVVSLLALLAANGISFANAFVPDNRLLLTRMRPICATARRSGASDDTQLREQVQRLTKQVKKLKERLEETAANVQTATAAADFPPLW